jgi:hypothetical protein
MTTIRWTRIGLSLALLGAGLACGGNSSTGPVAGTVTVSLVTPNSDDGVVLVTLTGPSFTTAQSASSAYHVYWRLVSAGEVRAIVVGNVTAGAVLTVNVDDVGKVAQYSGTVVEAASRSDVVRPSVEGYGVTFATTH